MSKAADNHKDSQSGDQQPDLESLILTQIQGLGAQIDGDSEGKLSPMCRMCLWLILLLQATEVALL